MRSKEEIGKEIDRLAREIEKARRAGFRHLVEEYIQRVLTLLWVLEEE